jgi:hypothetical protein
VIVHQRTLTRSPRDARSNCEKLGYTIRDNFWQRVTAGQENKSAPTIPTFEKTFTPKKANVQAAWKPVATLGAELTQVACVISNVATFPRSCVEYVTNTWLQSSEHFVIPVRQLPKVSLRAPTVASSRVRRANTRARITNRLKRWFQRKNRQQFHETAYLVLWHQPFACDRITVP